MLNRRTFFKQSMVGVGALSLVPMAGLSAADLSAGKGQGQFPKRFVFIRKSNGRCPFDFLINTKGRDNFPSALCL